MSKHFTEIVSDLSDLLGNRCVVTSDLESEQISVCCEDEGYYLICTRKAIDNGLLNQASVGFVDMLERLHSRSKRGTL